MSMIIVSIYDCWCEYKC